MPESMPTWSELAGLEKLGGGDRAAAGLEAQSGERGVDDLSEIVVVANDEGVISRASTSSSGAIAQKRPASVMSTAMRTLASQRTSPCTRPKPEVLGEGR